MRPNHSKKSYRRYKIGSLSFLVFLLLATLCVLSYYKTINDQKRAKLQQLEIAGNLTYQDFRKIIRHNIISLEGLRDRIVESNGSFKTYLKSDSERIIKQNQSIKFVEYINSEGIIDFIVPLEPNKEALYLNLKSTSYRYDSWFENAKDTITNITAWVKLTQAGKAFLVDVPVYYNDKFQGTISAGMDFTKQFNVISSKQNLYSVQIKDNYGNVFYSYNNPNVASFEPDQIYVQNIKPSSAKSTGPWKFEFMLNSPREFNAAFLQNFILFLGLFLSFLIGLLTYFFLLARIQSRNYRSINLKLNELNEDLDRERVRAEEASLAKTQFLSHMSHEIRTPLSAILGISEILEDKQLSTSDKEFLKLLQNSSRILMNLVNNILNMDKIESGKIEFLNEVFCPYVTIQRIVEIYAPVAKEKGIEVITNFEEIQNPNYVVGDISRTEQVITNIIGNATKFTERGSITVHYNEEIVEEKLKIILKVADTGLGIDSNKIDVIFERFKQLDFGITKKHQGSGLGLAITKSIVELMNGTIKVESEAGRGSTFTISLEYPIIAHKSKNSAKRKYRDLSHLNVLVVDDNILNLKILEKVLSKKNIKPDMASDGEGAIKKCAVKTYDLIFMDVHMPGMDGFEIVQYLRKMENKAVILGFSADVTQEAIERGLKSGMNDYLTKPIEQENLFAILGKYFF